MVFPVVGGDGKPTGYEISNSLRLTDNAYLNITRSSQSNTTGTFSAWIKTAAQNSFQLAGGHTDVNNRSYIYFPSSGGGFSGGLFSRTSGSLDTNFNTNAVYRDPSAWYHLVVAFDTTQSTESNRVKWYVNGEQITSFSASTYPSQNASIPILNKATQTIGAGYGASSISVWSDGYMAEVYYIDGTQYAASDFGETNDNGVWIPKDASGDLTFGTNGFYLEFKQTGTSQNSSGIGADTSGNDNHLAVNGLAATDVTTDTPTNNFCTLNPVAVSRFDNDGVYSEGNTKITSTSSDNDRFYSVATMGVTSGKWYWEIKVPTASKVETGVGILTEIMGTSQHYNNETSPNIISVNAGGNIYGKGGADYDDHVNWAADLSDNDIIMWALDMDNYELWYGINGTWQDSGDPTSGATGTGGIINETSNAYRTKLNHGDFIHPWVSDLATSGQTAYEINFGNPPFSISSGNSDANGYGNFEYAVPSGYYAICTKNLAEYG